MVVLFYAVSGEVSATDKIIFVLDLRQIDKCLKIILRKAKQITFYHFAQSCFLFHVFFAIIEKQKYLFRKLASILD